MSNQTIIGIGTACGGTFALSRWLNERGLAVGHQETWGIDWRREVHPERYAWSKRRLQKTPGDVAYWLTQAASDLLESLPRAKCVAVTKPKEQVVSDLLATRDPACIRETRGFAGLTFPSFKGGSLEEAWSMYCDEYELVLDSLRDEYQERMMEVCAEDLQDGKDLPELSAFLGISSQDKLAPDDNDYARG